ncbi:MAG TPA: PilZ domain-containing protein [Proteobacteria bacterium]|nr:PilZ domain-containing protein [Pseudomonadota bacterium]
MERRTVTRYNLQVPARVETLSDQGAIQLYEWKTRDVSSGGAFILTDGRSLPSGADVKVDLLLNSFSGAGSWVSVSGRVVRIENDGFGVCFDGYYQFVRHGSKLDI